MSQIDVIITCYNKQDTVINSIQSVIQQTFTDYQCFVIDDGSSDSSWQRITQVIENDNRFVAIKLKNSGVANARNFGISCDNAPFICCLDGDDMLSPKFLETCYNAITQDKSIGIVYTEMLLKHPDDNYTLADWKPADCNAQFQGKNQVPCCNLFRRSVFERLGGYKQRYAPRGAGAEDAELWLRFFKLGYKAVKCTEEPLFIYNAFGGFTQNGDYTEVNWLNWHNTTPLPSLENKERHANEYDNPLVSIIIPVIEKHLHLLPDALDSVEAQTFDNWECIVVFDNCEPSQSLLKAYPYIKPIYNTGKNGAGIARNLGARQAKGKYITFLDADDYLQAKFLEMTIGAIEHFNADWIYTDLYTQTIYNEAQFNLKVNELNNQGLWYQIIKKKNDAIEFIYRYNCDEFNLEKLWQSGIAAVTCLYRKADFDLVNGFDEEYNREDWEFHLRLAKHGKHGLRLPLPLFTYRLNTGIRREYADIAKNHNDSKQLKLQDVDRIHHTYNLGELQKMPCTTCNKKIKIQPAQTEDLTTLVYVGKIPGGTINGPVTRKRYLITTMGDKKVIYKVHPQDAQVFLKNGQFIPLPVEKAAPESVMISPTPVKTEVVKVSPQNKLQKSIEVAQQARDAALAQTLRELGYMEDEITSPLWFDELETMTVSQIKEKVNTTDLTKEQIETLYETEAQNKGRKGVLTYLQGLLK